MEVEGEGEDFEKGEEEKGKKKEDGQKPEKKAGISAGHGFIIRAIEHVILRERSDRRIPPLCGGDPSPLAQGDINLPPFLLWLYNFSKDYYCWLTGLRSIDHAKEKD